MCLGRLVTVVVALALVVAGVVAGMVSTVVGLASVVSYPALLAIGLPPLSANMTNTVALLFTGAGAAVGSRPELTGQGARIRRLAVITALGGGAGAALLLITPSQTFERVAPVLIAAASVALLVRRQPGGHNPGHGPPRHFARNPSLLAGVFGVAVYVGYFGAAGGILMLALLAAMVSEPLARTNAVKNILGAVANVVAAAAFAVVHRRRLDRPRAGAPDSRAGAAHRGCRLRPCGRGHARHLRLPVTGPPTGELPGS